MESLLQKGLRERRERIAHLPELARYEYECSGCYRFVWTDGSSEFLAETYTPCICKAQEVSVVVDDKDDKDDNHDIGIPIQESEDTEWWRK